MKRLLFLLLTLFAPALASAQVDLRVEKRSDLGPGDTVRLFWSGGNAQWDAYESEEARRVVSPARIGGNVADPEWVRADPGGDGMLVFFKVSCPNGCQEVCFDGLDNDGDGDADCADSDCAGTVDCTPESDCSDGIDNEGDDLIDCEDPDCGLGCDDGDECTTDICDPTAPGGCRNDPVICDDGDACNGIETCDPVDGSCLPGTDVVCDDGDACNGPETCDPADGSCIPGMDVDCSDGDLCTDDLCDPTTSDCSNPPVVCDDGDACNGIETCDPTDGSCLPGTDVVCDDADACNGPETCDPTDGACIPGMDVDCSDGDLCTDDLCDPTTSDCSNPPVICDDGDACNGSETCDPVDGSCLPGADVVCDDGDACNGIETCDPTDGSCIPGMDVDCSDGDLCTDDLCDPTTSDCSNPPVICDDGDACNGIETCDPIDGSCLPGTDLDCDDLDPCTVDGCDPAIGCTNDAEDCDDLNPCTVDSCDPVMGCLNEPDAGAMPAIALQLAGNTLASFPHFDFVRSYSTDATVEIGIDPSANPELVGQTCDVYVVETRTAADWCGDGSLVDVRGAPDTQTFVAGSITDNRFPIAASGQLDASAFTDIGHGYDVVLDCDRDGALGATDYIDGARGEPGFFVVHDLTTLGGLATGTFDEIGPLGTPPLLTMGDGDDMRFYYPALLDDPTYVGTFPLIVVSHGNGHFFDLYDFLQEHLASYGYIVMSHDNNTFWGIETASTSTINFTDRVFNEQATLGGGALDGHIEAGNISWIGHSRGGEGIARALDRLVDEGAMPPNNTYAANDIRLLLSIAPTDFQGLPQSDPHDKPYGLLYGAADGDVFGCPGDPVPYGFDIFERATGLRASAYVHGASHNDFNECGAGDDAVGPDQIGCPEAQQVQKGFILAFVEHVLEGNLAAKDFLWRQKEILKTVGVAPATITGRDFRDALAGGAFVIDDFQTEPDPAVSSSGEPVTLTVSNALQDLLDDNNSDLDWTATDPMNGLTRVNDVAVPADDHRGLVFDWTAGDDLLIEFAIAAAEADWTDDAFLSLRAGQMPRHPETTAVLEDLSFELSLIDGSGGSSAILIDAYGAGLEEPYQRQDGTPGSPCGAVGFGWQTEFEVIRIRLTDFLRDGAALDLSDVVSLRLRFGGIGSPQGRVILDDLRLSPE